MNVKAWYEKVIIPAYGIGKPEKNPMFFEKRVYQGSSGVVYPYPVVEKIEVEKHDKTYNAVFLDSIPGADPILINIDNFNRNSSLASIFEAKVGSGKLLFCTMDLSSDLDKRTVAKQLLYSLTNYMNGSKFMPEGGVSLAQIKALVSNSESNVDRGSIYDK